jgi:hydroxymethylbilane synthase
VISIEGRVGSVDGTVLLRAQHTGKMAAAEQLGVELAKDLLDQGAGELLKALYSH